MRARFNSPISTTRRGTSSIEMCFCNDRMLTYE